MANDHRSPNLNFAILNSVTPEYLEKIALNSKISFNPAASSNVQQISALQAHELVQARLAEANFKFQKEIEEKRKAEGDKSEGSHTANKKDQGAEFVEKEKVIVESRMTRSKVKAVFLEQGSDQNKGSPVTKKNQKAGRKNSKGN